MLHELSGWPAVLCRVLLAVSMAALLGGCDPDTELDEEQRLQLEQRVQKRWEARIARDWDKVWEFETPNFRRNFPRDIYRYKFSYTLNWELTGIEILNYDAPAAVASVAVRVMSEPAKHTSTASRAVGAVPTVIREKWIFIDGEWWYSATY